MTSRPRPSGVIDTTGVDGGHAPSSQGRSRGTATTVLRGDDALGSEPGRARCHPGANLPRRPIDASSNGVFFWRKGERPGWFGSCSVRGGVGVTYAVTGRKRQRRRSMLSTLGRLALALVLIAPAAAAQAGEPMETV